MMPNSSASTIRTVEHPFRILICSVQIPFVEGGAERHIDGLCRELRSRGFQTDIVRLPFKWYPPRQIINDCLAWRFLDLTSSYGMPVDLIIGTRFPSYIVKHPNKIAWVLHQHRQVYDLLTTDLTDFKDKADDDEVRRLIYDIDHQGLRECRCIFANSRNVADRMQKYLGVQSEPLYHPPPLAGSYFTSGYEDFVLSVGRLELNKRTDLLLQALARTRNPIRAIIVGSGPQRPVLEKLASDLEIQNRVTFAGFLQDKDLLDLYARCGAVFYSPVDEDYGYVTLEAYLSEKTIITTKDSGGVLEFAMADETALIADPDPVSMAAALDQWFLMPDKGKHLGIKGKESIRQISWDHVVDQLTSCLIRPPGIARNR